MAHSLKALEDFKISCKIVIAWGDMDVLGHVNSPKYFTYFETARVKYFESLCSLHYFTKTGITGVLARTGCNYISPLVYPNVINVGVRVTELRKDRIFMEYVIQAEAGRVIAFGESETVFLDFNEKKKTDIPTDLLIKINEFEQLK